MASGASPRSSVPPGLCGTCRHSRIVETRRGSTFRLCERSRQRPALPPLSDPARCAMRGVRAAADVFVRTGACLTLRAARHILRRHHEERAMNGTSTRRASAERPGGWWKPGRRRRRMDPGASGPNGTRATATPVGSGAERQRYRAAPIAREPADDRKPGRRSRSAAQPNEGGTAEGTTFRPGDDRSFLDSRGQR